MYRHDRLTTLLIKGYEPSVTIHTANAVVHDRYSPALHSASSDCRVISTVQIRCAVCFCGFRGCSLFHRLLRYCGCRCGDGTVAVVVAGACAVPVEFVAGYTSLSLGFWGSANAVFERDLLAVVFVHAGKDFTPGVEER